LSKCLKNYQNNERFLIIVLFREKGVFTANYFQKIINKTFLDNKKHPLVKVINFSNYLKFLSLGKDKNLSPKEKKMVFILKKSIQLSIKAFNSDSSLEKLKKISEKYLILLKNLKG